MLTTEEIAAARSVNERWLGEMLVRDEVTGEPRPVGMWEGWLVVQLGRWERQFMFEDGGGI